MQSLTTMPASGMPEMGSSEPWIAVSQVAMTALRTKQLMTNEERQMLRDFLAGPIPVFPVCSREHFDKSLRALTVLPRARDDELKGELRVHLYWRKLGHYSEHQWSYAANVALDRFDWFPTIKQLRQLLEEVESPEARYHSARALANKALTEDARSRYLDLCRRGRAGELKPADVLHLPVKTRQLLAEDRVFSAADLALV